MHWPPLPHGHSATGRIMPMKNSNWHHQESNPRPSRVAQCLNQLHHHVPHTYSSATFNLPKPCRQLYDLNITGTIRPQKTLKKTRIKLYNTLALPVLLYGSETWTIKARDVRRISAAEMKYMRRTAGYTWDRLQNKFTHCKGIRNNTGSTQTAGIQEELDTTCKQNALWQTTQDNETLFPNWQKESWQTSEETSRYVRPERVNKWPNCMTDVWWWWWWRWWC